MSTETNTTKTYRYEFDTCAEANRFADRAALVINPADITSIDGRVTLDYVTKQDLELIKVIA